MGIISSELLTRYMDKGTPRAHPISIKFSHIFMVDKKRWREENHGITIRISLTEDIAGVSGKLLRVCNVPLHFMVEVTE